MEELGGYGKTTSMLWRGDDDSGDSLGEELELIIFSSSLFF